MAAETNETDDMKGASLEATTMASKFRGCLLGSLIGDCLGRRFEHAEIPVRPDERIVARFFRKLRDEPDYEGGKTMPYTDDTAMTKVLAASLVEKEEVDVDDLAKQFTKEYSRRQSRGYGIHVVHVFDQLKKKPADVLKPARDQFRGTGSYGNGAAMRVSPVALFYHKDKDKDKMIEAAKKQSLVTHAHANGYNGAILQCLAIQLALEAEPNKTVDKMAFVRQLHSEMTDIEKPPRDYCTQLKKMEELLSEPSLPHVDKVIEKLGNNVTALKSVPTAIFAYLAAQDPIEGIDAAANQFERTVHYAINIGGDTDTIGCMAGGIAGAHLGIDAIPEYLSRRCEAREVLLGLADQLHEKWSKNRED